MYKRTIDQLTPAINQDGVAVQVDSRAAAILANPPLNKADVTAATFEKKARKVAKEYHGPYGPVVIIDEEIQATVRRHAIIAEHVEQSYPPVAPAWFGPAIADAVNNAVGPAVTAAFNAAVDNIIVPAVTAAVNNAVGPAVTAAVNAAVDTIVGPAVTAAIDNAVAPAVTAAVDNAVAPAIAIGPALAALKSSVGTLLARSDNQELKRRNNEILMINSPNDVPFWPLKKEVEGNGVGLPGYEIAPANLPALVAVGVPVPTFPEDVRRLNSMTHRQLSRLSALYNNDFGIVPADTTLVARVTKFKMFFSVGS